MPQDNPLLQQMSKDEGFFKGVLLPALIILAVLFAGAGTGWFLSKDQSAGKIQESVDMKGKLAPGATVKSGGNEVGLDDEKTFKDKAEGTLEQGGIDGEGTHKLVRVGGQSQTVYLTSSVIDLDEFTGKQVEIWGETNKGNKAAWLMDVGRIKVLDE